MKHLIIGYGEIGRAIEAILKEKKDNVIETCDKDGKPAGEYDFVHICFPYSEHFARDVQRYLDNLTYKHCIIHSTVKPGTTRFIGVPRVYYSPVRGRHDNGMVEDIKKYVKYIACPISQFEVVRNIWNLKTEWVESSDSLEFAKIFDTTYMLVNVIAEKWAFKTCKELNLDYDFIYRKYCQSYNDQVKPEWRRPIYDHTPGPVGGHCLVPNLTLMPDNEFIRIMDMLNEKYGCVDGGDDGKRNP